MLHLDSFTGITTLLNDDLTGNFVAISGHKYELGSFITVFSCNGLVLFGIISELISLNTFKFCLFWEISYKNRKKYLLSILNKGSIIAPISLVMFPYWLEYKKDVVSDCSLSHISQSKYHSSNKSCFLIETKNSSYYHKIYPFVHDIGSTYEFFTVLTTACDQIFSVAKRDMLYIVRRIFRVRSYTFVGSGSPRRINLAAALHKLFYATPVLPDYKGTPYKHLLIRSKIYKTVLTEFIWPFSVFFTVILLFFSKFEDIKCHGITKFISFFPNTPFQTERNCLSTSFRPFFDILIRTKIHKIRLDNILSEDSMLHRSFKFRAFVDFIDGRTTTMDFFRDLLQDVQEHVFSNIKSEIFPHPHKQHKHKYAVDTEDEDDEDESGVQETLREIENHGYAAYMEKIMRLYNEYQEAVARVAAIKQSKKKVKFDAISYVLDNTSIKGPERTTSELKIIIDEMAKESPRPSRWDDDDDEYEDEEEAEKASQNVSLLRSGEVQESNSDHYDYGKSTRSVGPLKKGNRALDFPSSAEDTNRSRALGGNEDGEESSDSSLSEDDEDDEESSDSSLSEDDEDDEESEDSSLSEDDEDDEESSDSSLSEDDEDDEESSEDTNRSRAPGSLENDSSDEEDDDDTSIPKDNPFPAQILEELFREDPEEIERGKWEDLMEFEKEEGYMDALLGHDREKHGDPNSLSVGELNKILKMIGSDLKLVEVSNNEFDVVERDETDDDDGDDVFFDRVDGDDDDDPYISD